jgi:hypothetical protein
MEDARVVTPTRGGADIRSSPGVGPAPLFVGRVNVMPRLGDAFQAALTTRSRQVA